MKRSASPTQSELQSPPHKHIALDSPYASDDPTTQSPVPTPSPSPTNGGNTVDILQTLPVELLEIIVVALEATDLAECRLVSKLIGELVEKRFKSKFAEDWMSDLNFEPIQGSWRVQYITFNTDFSKCKHGLPKITWCVENRADRKLYSLLHSPPPHRKRMLRLLNPPTMLRMEDSPLHYACAVGCIEVVTLILSFDNAKECINKYALGVLTIDGISSFWTPLHYAIRYKHAEVVKLLISNGADVHTEKGVMSPFHFAQLVGDANIKKILSTAAK